MLEKMTAREMVEFAYFQKFANEAFEAEEIINKAFESSFGPGKTSIPAFHTESFGEYYGDATLSIDGIWEYSDNWGGGNTWNIKCNAEGIYEALKLGYYSETKQYGKCDGKNSYDIAVRYFRKFIEECKEKIGLTPVL